MWWCVSTSQRIGLPGKRARVWPTSHSDCASVTGASNTIRWSLDLDHQAVVRAALGLEHARREFLQAQALRRARIVADVVRVEVGADELAADHPLVGHVARGGLRRVGAQLGRHLEGARVDRLD